MSVLGHGAAESEFWFGRSLLRRHCA